MNDNSFFICFCSIIILIVPYSFLYTVPRFDSSYLSRDPMAKSRDKLKKYQSKRNFDNSPEPKGKKLSLKKNHSKAQPTFVVQKHDATSLHYDLRLEVNGVLKSWAIPKGLSTNPEDKHLAIATEDHPIEYATFEGVIPPLHYGAGPVIVWDKGTFENTKKKDGMLIPLEECYKNGHIEIELHGKKLQGSYTLIRITPIKNWLCIKIKDKHATKKSTILEKDTSVISNKTIEDLYKKAQNKRKIKQKKHPKAVDKKIKIGSHIVDITHANKVLFGTSGLTKKDLINYYLTVTPIIMPYLHNRTISMQRFPQGIDHESGFFQKDAGDYFPSWITLLPLEKEHGGITKYVVINKPETLIYLANQNCITIHPWLSKTDKLHKPDRLIFDLDPSEKTPFSVVQKVAKKLKQLLDELELTSFYMLTGSRGVHVVIPLKRVHSFEETNDFAHMIADLLASQFPEFITSELHKSKRGKRVFIDWLRNNYGATAVAPYAVRAYENAPVAMPITWKELQAKGLTSQKYTIKNAMKRINKVGDIWHDIQKYATTLTKARKKLEKSVPSD